MKKKVVFSPAMDDVSYFHCYSFFIKNFIYGHNFAFLKITVFEVQSIELLLFSGFTLRVTKSRIVKLKKIEEKSRSKQSKFFVRLGD